MTTMRRDPLVDDYRGGWRRRGRASRATGGRMVGEIEEHLERRAG